MAKKKNTPKVPKSKGLFDHISQVTSNKKKGYWESLSETERKTFSPYMVYRFLSMNIDYIELINELQMHSLEPKQVYDVLMDVLPKKKVWNKYIKGSTQDNNSLSILAEYYELGIKDIKYNFKMISEEDQKSLIEEIKKSYGQRFAGNSKKKKS